MAENTEEGNRESDEANENLQEDSTIPTNDQTMDLGSTSSAPNQIRTYEIPTSDRTSPETASIRVLVIRNRTPWRSQTLNLESLSIDTDNIQFLVSRNDLASTSSSATTTTASIRFCVTRNQIPTCDQTVDLGLISFETDRIRITFTSDDQTGSSTLETRRLRVLPPTDITESLALPIEEDNDDSVSLITQPPFDVSSPSSSSRQLSPYAEAYIPQNTHQTFRSNQSAEPNLGAQENLYQQYPMDVFYIIVPSLVSVQTPIVPVQTPIVPVQAPMGIIPNQTMVMVNTSGQMRNILQGGWSGPQMQPVRSQGFYGGPSFYRGRGSYRGRARRRGRRG